MSPAQCQMVHLIWQQGAFKKLYSSHPTPTKMKSLEDIYSPFLPSSPPIMRPLERFYSPQSLPPTSNFFRSPQWSFPYGESLFSTSFPQFQRDGQSYFPLHASMHASMCVHTYVCMRGYTGTRVRACAQCEPTSMCVPASLAVHAHTHSQYALHTDTHRAHARVQTQERPAEDSLSLCLPVPRSGSVSLLCTKRPL